MPPGLNWKPLHLRGYQLAWSKPCSHLPDYCLLQRHFPFCLVPVHLFSLSACYGSLVFCLAAIISFLLTVLLFAFSKLAWPPFLFSSKGYCVITLVRIIGSGSTTQLNFGTTVGIKRKKRLYLQWDLILISFPVKK